jgi:hypothetical protein
LAFWRLPLIKAIEELIGGCGKQTAALGQERSVILERAGQIG